MKKIILATILTLSPTLALAADTTGDEQQVFTALNNITNILFVLFLGVAVVMILFAAFKFLTAGSNPNNAQTAKMMVVYTAIAVALAVSARAFPDLVRNAIGQPSAEVYDRNQFDFGQ
ncbi:MAG: pilin [Candidatus Paceibacterota bacterium]